SGNDGRPKLSDLRDSGAIEQDADVVLMLRRPCKYPGSEGSDDETLAIVDVAKHRNGQTGEVILNFEDSYTRFRDRTMGMDQPAAMPAGNGAQDDDVPEDM
ncbi:MAG: DnaB-like helicase C-terminal domain-containing protein, partial [Kiritimatiellia bacterium]